jgi:hypothetical protein
MTFRKTSHRWALWAFAAALLLRAAMPWLASASAEMQGKALVEVCTVYGVSLKPLGHDGSSSAPASDHDSAHDDEQCALSALTALGAFTLPSLAPALGESHATAPPAAYASSEAPDASAAWVARRKHGPPTFS